jgi:thiol-disulfide isomerase/thioredoxin
MKRLSLSVLIILAFGAGFWTFLGGKSLKSNSEPELVGHMRNFLLSKNAAIAVSLPLLQPDKSEVPLTDWKGKVVLLNFWATWCAPCIREMPSLQRLAGTYPAKEFAVIALSQDSQGWTKIKPFLQKHRLERLPVYADPGLALGRKFGIRALPTTVILGRSGKEMGRLVGHAEWDSQDARNLIDFYLSR